MARGRYHRARNDPDDGQHAEIGVVESAEQDKHWHAATSYYPQPHVPASYQQRYQQAYYDRNEEVLALQAQRRAARARGTVCFALCVFTAVAVLVCVGLAVSGSPTPRAQAMDVLQAVKKATLVEFTIIPKPHTVYGKYGRKHEETTDFYGFTWIQGKLFPYVSSDDDRRLSFDGWIHVETNTTIKYDLLLGNHRGYRVTTTAPTPLATRSRSRCVSPTDMVPLHDLHSAAASAFTAQDYASFQVNCSQNHQPPIEIVFARIPFVFCPEDLSNRTFSPVANKTQNGSSTSAFSFQSLAVHGEKMLIQLVIVNSHDEVARARVNQAKAEGKLELLWGNSTESVSTTCPSLEAPLSTDAPRAASVLHEILEPPSSSLSRQTHEAVGD